MFDSTPSDTALRSLKASVYRGFSALIDAFGKVTFPCGAARLRVVVRRHLGRTSDLARFALAMRTSGVPVGQAISWYRENIPAPVAVQYLRYRWRAADARRVATAICNCDPSLTRSDSLGEGLAWAESGRTGDQCLDFIACGYTVGQADALGLAIAYAILDYGLGEPGGPSIIDEWLDSGIPAAWTLRYINADIYDVTEALVLDKQRLADPAGFNEALGVIAALRRSPE